MKTMKTMMMICVMLSGCVYGEDSADEVEIDNVAKKGIVDCNVKISKPYCKECGNGGTTTCCPPADQGWECDVMCDHWVPADPRTGKPKSCP